MVTVVLILIVIGVLLWFAETHLPMDPTIKQIMRVFVIACVVLWLLGVLGLIPLGDLPVPRLR